MTLATIVVFGRFATLDSQAYGMFKSLVSGGALAGGLFMALLFGLGLEQNRRWPWIVAASWLAIWVGLGAGMLERSYQGESGFRAREVELGRQLQRLPAGSSVLADGAAEEPGAFQLRMMTGYFGTAGPTDLDLEGLATTSSYISPGGITGQEPAAPWRYVVTTSAPTPIATVRRVLWQSAAYRVLEAPVTDVTTFGKGWLPTERDPTGSFAWVTSSVEFVLSNRGSNPRRVRLKMQLWSNANPIEVRLQDGTRQALWTVQADRPTPAALPVLLPPMSTRIVHLDLPARTPTAPPDPRRVRVHAVRVVPSETQPE